jgi:hypothetical protein
MTCISKIDNLNFELPERDLITIKAAVSNKEACLGSNNFIVRALHYGFSLFHMTVTSVDRTGRHLHPGISEALSRSGCHKPMLLSLQSTCEGKTRRSELCKLCLNWVNVNHNKGRHSVLVSWLDRPA